MDTDERGRLKAAACLSQTRPAPFDRAARCASRPDASPRLCRCSDRVQGRWPCRMRAGMGRSTTGAPRSASQLRSLLRAADFRACRRLARLSPRFLSPDLCRLGGFCQKTTSPASSMRSHWRAISRARRRSERFSEIRPQWSSRSACSSRRRSFLTQRTRRFAEDAKESGKG